MCTDEIRLEGKLPAATRWENPCLAVSASSQALISCHLRMLLPLFLLSTTPMFTKMFFTFEEAKLQMTTDSDYWDSLSQRRGFGVSSHNRLVLFLFWHTVPCADLPFADTKIPDTCFVMAKRRELKLLPLQTCMQEDTFHQESAFLKAVLDWLKRKTSLPFSMGSIALQPWRLSSIFDTCQSWEEEKKKRKDVFGCRTGSLCLSFA